MDLSPGIALNDAVDFHAYPGSKASRLPEPLKTLVLLARNFRSGALPFHGSSSDNVTTVHNTPFGTPRFRKAYARAVKAAGWDFHIPWRIHQALWCSRIAQGVEGDFVELGTGRGFIMSAVLEDGLSRPLHLFDTFLPNWTEKDGQTGEVSPYYASSFEDVQRNFSEWPNVTLHRGNVYDTLPKAGLEKVAFLHVDMNHPDPEEFGIRQLWHLMPKGAVMLLDDYAYQGFERQNERDNRLASELGFDILTTPTGQGIVVKSL